MATGEFAFIPFRESDRRYVPLVIALTVVLLALSLVFFVIFRPEVVSGDSMADTLHSGDRLLFTRGYESPSRGDIVSADVVIHGSTDRIIKRVVAIAGDTVEVYGDIVTVNGKEVSWPGVIIVFTAGFRPPTVVVPDGYVYLMGDNRPRSLDSRYFGTVPLSAVNGKAVAIFSPLNRVGRID